MNRSLDSEARERVLIVGPLPGNGHKRASQGEDILRPKSIVYLKLVLQFRTIPWLMSLIITFVMIVIIRQI